MANWRWRFVVVLCVVFCSVSVFGQLDEGDTCETRAGKDGICKYITQCRSALDDLNKGIFPSDICGYNGTQSIICCVGRNQAPAPTRPTRPVKPRPKPTVGTVPRPGFSNVGSAPGDRAAAMCKEYAQYAYETIYSPALSLGSTFAKTLECPIKTQTLIVGGTLAGRREFPHMVQIGYITGSETTWDCGGTLISPTFILTAGHCLTSNSRGDAKLARGGISNQTDITHLQTRNIIERIKYPQYNFQKYHDIGLLKLSKAFALDTYLRPACLYTEKSIPYTTAVASGWGKTDFAVDEGSQDLLKVTLEFFTTAQCNKTYRRMINDNSELPMGIVEDIMICYGSTKDRKDTCQGDSGGPLQLIHPETQETKCMYDIIGITSFGVACGLAKNLPGVYTRVSNYVEWIENTVWPR